MEPVKIIQIARIENEKLIGYGTQLAPYDEKFAALYSFLKGDFSEAISNTRTDLVFRVPFVVGEKLTRREVYGELNFPRLKEIADVATLVNLLEFYSEFIFDAVDWGTVTGAESDLPHSNGLQRYWCLSDDLVWVNRPCRSSKDFEYIKLKVEEFILEKKDEYTTLVRKVERLRKILDKEFHGSREFPTDDVLAFVMKRDGGKCALCDSQETLQFDHIYPKSKGGNDEPDNLRVLCRSCNIKRGNLSNRQF